MATYAGSGARAVPERQVAAAAEAGHVAGQLRKATVPQAQADAILNANSNARLAALRTSLWVVALIAVAALFFTGLIPHRADWASQAAFGRPRDETGGTACCCLSLS